MTDHSDPQTKKLEAEHYHNTALCEECRSTDHYAKMQYIYYERETAALRERVKELEVIISSKLSTINDALVSEYQRGLEELEKWINSEEQCESINCGHYDTQECILTKICALKEPKK